MADLKKCSVVSSAADSNCYSKKKNKIEFTSRNSIKVLIAAVAKFFTPNVK